jgi:hypothetical protein
VGLFGRKRVQEGGGEAGAPATAPTPTGIPDYGFSSGHWTPSKPVSDIARTTSYPQGQEGKARVVWKERTTSYGEAAQWNRRTYDSIN